MQSVFPQWIGHSREILGDTETAEEWYGLMIHNLLWRRMGLFIRDDSGSYRVFHQLVGDYLATINFSNINRLRRRRLALGVLLAVTFLVLSVWYGYSQRSYAPEDIESAIDHAAMGYSSFGVQYEQLRELTDLALTENEEDFFWLYDRRLSSVKAEAVLSDMEKQYIDHIEDKILPESERKVSWSGLPFDGELAVELIDYTSKRCAYYAQILPVLAFWMSSEQAHSISPEFADCLAAVLEADAAVASELYHQSCAVHLDTAEGAWVKNVRAMIDPDLETHRVWDIKDDRGSYLENLRGLLTRAEEKLEKEKKQVELEMKYGT